MVLFQVLGPLEVRGRDGVAHRLGGGKPATVLAALLQQPNAWVATDQLIENTWQEQAVPVSAEANLKTYVWQLRRLLPEHADGPRIESGPGVYRLRITAGELDAHCAAEYASSARDAVEIGDHATSLTLVQQALGLWRGRPFEGLDSMAGDAVSRLDELWRQLRETLADAQFGLGRTAEAVATLHELTADDPLREDTWARLVRALHTMGRPAPALAVYHKARQLLATELGVRPGPELAAAYRAVRGDEGPDTPAEAAPRRELPRAVPGFTGRDRELGLLGRACTGTAPVVLVAGEAGSGKTALAVFAAHRLSDRFPDGQFFVDLYAHGRAEPMAPADTLARLLRGIGFPPALIPADPGERAALWRSELASRRILLVLDDAVDREQVEPLLPATGTSAVVVTSRNRNWHLDGAVRVELGPLAPAEAAAMFRAAAGQRGGAADPVDAVAVTDIVRRCGGLPGTLRDAAARLQTRPLWTVQRLAVELVAPLRPARELVA